MATKLKNIANKEETLDKLDLRIGRVLSAEIEPGAPKKSYKIIADFGKFGKRTTVARLTHHAPDALINQLIIGVLNFEARTVGATTSEFLLLGPQFPKADSGEASFLTTAVDVKIGGKIF